MRARILRDERGRKAVEEACDRLCAIGRGMCTLVHREAVMQPALCVAYTLTPHGASALSLLDDLRIWSEDLLDAID